jgi:hypothetical protein
MIKVNLPLRRVPSPCSGSAETAAATGSSRIKAVFAANGNRPQAVIMVPGILELDMSGQPREQNRSTAALHAPLARAA